MQITYEIQINIVRNHSWLSSICKEQINCINMSLNVRVIWPQFRDGTDEADSEKESKDDT